MARTGYRPNERARAVQMPALPFTSVFGTAKPGFLAPRPEADWEGEA